MQARGNLRRRPRNLTAHQIPEQVGSTAGMERFLGAITPVTMAREQQSPSPCKTFPEIGITQIPGAQRAKIGGILWPGMTGLSAGVGHRIKLPTSGDGMKLDMERLTTDTRRCLGHHKQGIEHQNLVFQSRQAPSMGEYLKWIDGRRSGGGMPFPEKLVEEEAKQRNSYRQNHLARESEEALTGVKRAHQVQPRIMETWKRVKLPDGHGNVNRKFVGVQMVQHGGLDATGPRETVVGEVPAPTRDSHRRQVHDPPPPSVSQEIPPQGQHNYAEVTKPPSARAALGSRLFISSKPHDQELLHELFDLDIRSKPTVKLPPTSPWISPASAKQYIPVAPRAMLRHNAKWQFQTAKVYKAFGAKDFSNAGGRFIPVRLPGRSFVQVLWRRWR